MYAESYALGKKNMHIHLRSPEPHVSVVCALQSKRVDFSQIWYEGIFEYISRIVSLF